MFLIVSVVALFSVVGAFAVVPLDDSPPANAPYKGGYWLTGTVNTLGVVNVYFPNNVGWCVDSNGNLFRYTSDTVNGIIVTSNGTRYTFRAPAFSIPQYRATDSSYTYTDFYFKPTGGNVVVHDTFEPVITETQALPYIGIFIVGLIFVAIITKRR